MDKQVSVPIRGLFNLTALKGLYRRLFGYGYGFRPH